MRATRPKGRSQAEPAAALNPPSLAVFIRAPQLLRCACVWILLGRCSAQSVGARPSAPVRHGSSPSRDQSCSTGRPSTSNCKRTPSSARDATGLLLATLNCTCEDRLICALNLAHESPRRRLGRRTIFASTDIMASGRRPQEHVTAATRRGTRFATN